MMKNFILPLILMFGCYGMSQAKLNKYKYIIVPTKFEAFKSENQYQTSTLIKYNLVENGFTAVYDNDMPAELLANRCIGLLLALNDDSSMFSTKVTLTLKDCLSNVVYTTVEGISKEKDYKFAYSEAIKECFKSLSGLDYQYAPEGNKELVAISFKDDVKQLENAAEKDKEIRFEDMAEVKTESNRQKVVQQQATLEEQSYKNMEPVPSNITMAENNPEMAPPTVAYKTDDATVLYAQPTAFGYQLVDVTPKIAMWLWKTSLSNVFRAEAAEGVPDGVVLKKGDKWYFEYYEGEKLMGQELNIKF